MNDQLNFNASLHLLANIGESASKISDELKNEYPKIPLIKTKEFRNRIVPDNMGIDLFITYEVIIKDLILFESQVKQLLKKKIADKVFDSEEVQLTAQSTYYKHIAFTEIL